MPVRAVKARSELKYTLWPTKDTFTGMLERQSQKTVRAFSSALNKFKYWKPISNVMFSPLSNYFSTACKSEAQYVLIISMKEISTCSPAKGKRVHPALYGARGGPVPEAPVHHGHCFDSSGIMGELWLGCWEGRVAALQSWPPPNPGKPILGSLPPHSEEQTDCWCSVSDSVYL